MPDWTSHSTARWATASEFDVARARCGRPEVALENHPGSSVRLAHDLLHRSGQHTGQADPVGHGNPDSPSWLRRSGPGGPYLSTNGCTIPLSDTYRRGKNG